MNPSGFADLKNESIINADSIVIGTLILPNLNPSSVPYIDSTNTLQDRVLTNGQVLMGVTGGDPVAAALTGTTNEVIVTNGPGSITLSTPQPIATTSSPTFSNITITNNVAGPINTRTADNIVSNTSTGVLNNLASFVSDKVIKDTGISASTGPWLPLAGGTMTATTGTINMNSSQLTNVSLITPATTNLLFGTGASSTSLRNIAIGNTNAILGSSNDTISIGSNMTLSSFISDDVLIGNNITIASGGNDSVCIGKGASIGSGPSNILIGESASITGSGTQNVVIGQAASTSTNACMILGFGSTITGSGVIAIGAGSNTNANKAHMFGTGLGNLTANSLLIDADTNIRSNLDASTDLGTVTNRFKDIYLSGSIVGPGPYLPLAGGVMTGSIDFGNLSATNYFRNESSVAGGNVIWGSGTTITIAPGGNNIRNNYFGYNNDGTGFGLNLIGNENHQTVGAGDCNLIGSSNTVAGGNSSTYGNTNSITGSNSVAIGTANSIGANYAYVLGDTAVNNTANSILLGSLNIVNIRPNNNGTCDNGTSAAKWKDFYSSGNIISSGATDSTSTSTGTITTLGGIGVALATNIGTNLKVFGTTDSTTTATGSIQGLGGLGLAKALTAGGIIKTTDSTDATSTTAASIVTAGGIGCAKQIRSAGSCDRIGFSYCRLLCKSKSNTKYNKHG